MPAEAEAAAAVEAEAEQQKQKPVFTQPSIMVQAHLCFLLLLLHGVSLFHQAHPLNPTSTATPSTLWTANFPASTTARIDSSTIQIILLHLSSDTTSPSYGCGFLCIDAPCTAILFSVFVAAFSARHHPLILASEPELVWSANRGQPVRQNATLNFSKDGDLTLRNADGALIWSTATSGRSVAGMNITESSDMVLFDHRNSAVWRSFDHPTDTMVPGQSLHPGMGLIANVSTANSTLGQVNLTLSADNLRFFIDPQCFYLTIPIDQVPNETASVTLTNGSLAILPHPGEPTTDTQLPLAHSVQVARLELDGHLRLYEYNPSSSSWNMVDDVLHHYLDNCDYPKACGGYGRCKNGQCSCLLERHFKPIDSRNPDLGCELTTPISCESVQDHRLISVQHVAYSCFSLDAATTRNVSEGECKESCLKSCSCKAAVYAEGAFDRYCLLASKVLTVHAYDYGGQAHFYVKVQVSSNHPSSIQEEEQG